jgi:GH24 family phage-related lysozyme (muramidase)
MFKFYKKFVLKYIITLLSLLFTINISYSQSPPVASNVSAATVKNTNASIHLVASDADFDSLTYSIVSNPSNGTVSLSGDIVTYTPTTNYTGTDTFTFKANDGASDSATKTVTITVISGYKATQTQIGADIDGEAAGDYSGISVSFNEDGTTLAIGGYQNDDNGSNAGQVRVYSWNGSAWTKLGNDIDGEAASDESGCSVSLSSDGTTVAIGAYANDDTASLAGHVRVYSWNGSAWTKLGDDIDGEAGDDRSGFSVSLSSDGTTVAIGAYANDGNGSNAGHVRVYSWNGSAWTKLGNDIDGEAASDYSGISVSLSSDGTTLAIGAYGNDGTANGAGHVRVYSWNGSTWTKLGDDIDGEAAIDSSGVSVSLSSDGTTVAIGAYQNDGNGSNAGHVRVYSWNGSAWTKLGNDIDGEAAGDESGVSVSLSSDGTTVAIGAYLNDGTASNAGHVRVYSWNGSAWTKLGDDIDGEAADDRSGYSVSLSSDGTTVAIGAWHNNGNGSKAGHVRVYNLVNDTNSPVAVDDTLTVLEDASLTSKDVIANDTDTDGDTLSLTAVTTAGTGTVAINSDGVSVDYTPAANFNGTEVITYTVSDGTLTDATGTLTITVTAVNDAPVAVDDTLTVDEDASLTSKDVIANDTDVDGDTLSLTAVTTAGTGTVAINSDGVSVDYTPAANFNGTEVITYTVSDGTLTDATGTLTITVTAVNDAPVAVDDTLTVDEDASLTSKGCNSQ